MLLRWGFYVLILCIFVGWAGHAAAGGLNRSRGVGARGTAVGGAYTAIADDASLFYYNPAGMSQFTEPYAELGLDLLIPKFSYDSPLRGRADSEDWVVHALPLFGYVHPINDFITAGVGAYVPYGMGADFGRNPQALNYHTTSLISITNLSPGISLKLNDELSLGLTADVGFGQFRCKTPFDVAGHYVPMPTDNKGDGFGLGASLGVLWANDWLSLGAMYSTGATTHLDGATEMGAGVLRMRDGFKADIEFPERASAGIAFRPIERLQVSFDASWYGYTGDFDTLELDFDTIPMKKSQKMDWQDNHAFHLGVSYKLNDAWTARAGYAFVTHAIPDETVNLVTPDMNGSDVALGIECAKGPLSVTGFVLYSWGSRSVGSGLAKEEYGVDNYSLGFETAWHF
jgi:long-chain fatty acid transport protein